MATMTKNVKLAELNTMIANVFFEYPNSKDSLIEYKCLCFNDNYEKSFDKNLKKLFFNSRKFCKYDINKLILLLRKGVHPY